MISEILSEAVALYPTKPGVDFNCSSCFSTISRSTSLGVAPGHKVTTPISGSITFGVSLYGSCVRETSPNIRIKIIPTKTLTGFFIDISIIFINLPSPLQAYLEILSHYLLQ